MATDHIKRGTEKISKDIDEVIVRTDGALKVVATAVQEVNETLAVHAAWTEERFDQVHERLAGLETGQRTLRADLSRLEAGVRADMRGLEKSLRHDMSRMERRIRGDLTELRRDLTQLAGRVEEMLATMLREDGPRE